MLTRRTILAAPLAAPFISSPGSEIAALWRQHRRRVAIWNRVCDEPNELFLRMSDWASEPAEILIVKEPRTLVDFAMQLDVAGVRERAHDLAFGHYVVDRINRILEI